MCDWRSVVIGWSVVLKPVSWVCMCVSVGAWLLAGVMYAWQFPHFCALSWNLRGDYSRAGYRMMCVLRPAVCRRQSVQYSLLVTALCLAMPLYGVTTWTFAIDSLPLNVYLTLLACKFYTRADSSSARRLFHFSLIHLPALLALLLLSKRHTSNNTTTSSRAPPTEAPPTEAPTTLSPPTEAPTSDVAHA